MNEQKLTYLFLSLVEIILLAGERSHGNHKISNSTLEGFSVVYVVEKAHDICLDLSSVEIWERCKDFLEEHTDNVFVIGLHLVWATC